MCVIIIKPLGIDMPKKEILKRCYNKNPDGAGYAYHNKGKIFLRKGFCDFENFYNSLTSKNISDTAILHFRIATSGLRDNGNCHPYVLDPENIRKTSGRFSVPVMAHNGMFNNLSDDKILSDTGVFIEKIMGDKIIYDNLYNSTIEKLLQNYITTNKLAFLFPNNTFVTIGDFSDSDGCLYSNMLWKPYKSVSYCAGRMFDDKEDESGYYREIALDMHHKLLDDSSKNKMKFTPPPNSVEEALTHTPISTEKYTGKCAVCYRWSLLYKYKAKIEIYGVCNKCRDEYKRSQDILIWGKCEKCNKDKYLYFDELTSSFLCYKKHKK